MRIHAATAGILTVLAAWQSADAALLAKLDFGGTSGDQVLSSSTAPAAYTNVTNLSSLGPAYPILNYTTAAASGATVKVTTGFTAMLGGATSTPGGAAAIFAGTATSDAFYTSTSALLTFSGLSADNYYTFTLFAARAGAASRIGTYDFTGLNTASAELEAGNNASNVITATNIQPTALGVITLGIKPSTGSAAGYINALQIEFAPVPEPTSGLALTSVLSLPLLRRRRN